MTVPLTLPLYGGCHCKALRFTLTATPVDVYAWHCTDCQNLTGFAFGIGVVVPGQAFTLTGTPNPIPRVLGSGRTDTRWICPDCRVWIDRRQSAPRSEH